jgi:hypothetical protein
MRADPECLPLPQGVNDCGYDDGMRWIMQYDFRFDGFMGRCDTFIDDIQRHCWQALPSYGNTAERMLELRKFARAAFETMESGPQLGEGAPLIKEETQDGSGTAG